MGTMGQGNRLFGRAAYVGLKCLRPADAGPAGEHDLPRHGQVGHYRANIFSISSLDLYLPNARSDNAIGYLGVFKELTVGATYSFGRDASSAGGPAATGCAGEVPGTRAPAAR
jgi:predicted porin